MLIPTGDVSFRQAKSTGEAIFSIKSPLTEEWTEFTVTQQQIDSGKLPPEVEDFGRYYQFASWLVSHGRNMRVAAQDLRPLDHDECRIFGVPTSRLNAGLTTPRSKRV